MELLYCDEDVIVCIKPPRVLSTDEPGGLPDMIRQFLKEPKGNVRTVHRLDRVVSGVMVLARNKRSASELSRQVREGQFHKEYLAVVHGKPESDQGEFRDLLFRDKARKMTMVVEEPGKDVQEAILRYRLLGQTERFSLQHIQLETGRTHQIRVQFSSRGLPLVGERKYASVEDDCEIALWSYRIGFLHPKTGEEMHFSQKPQGYPWDLFSL